MAGFETIRGDGLIRAHRALAGLEDDPQLLERARRRFSDSPPPYTSNHSHASTVFDTPEPPSDEQQRRAQRLGRLVREREASQPYRQFMAQRKEEMTRAWKADPRVSSRGIMPIGLYDQDAEKLVRDRWVEQGIWKDKWGDGSNRGAISGDLWKHEEPLELESETETDAQPDCTSVPFSFYERKPRPKSDDEKRQTAERRVIREREREASRPFHQFVYQISKERERIQGESTSGEATAAAYAAADINTKAYEAVKSTWCERGIWNWKWNILPGMSWKHEEPLEEEADNDSAAAQANHVENGMHDVEAPPRRVFGSPSPVESDHPHPSGTVNASQRGPSADDDSDGLENGGGGHSRAASNSRRHERSGGAIHSMTRPMPPRNQTRPSHADGLNEPETSTSLGPVRSSKVSKATRRRRPGLRRRPSDPQEVSPDDAPLLARAHIPESPQQNSNMPPRRSKRIQSTKSGMAKESTRIASGDSPKATAQSRPKRTVARKQKSADSANSQGVRKRPVKTRGRTKRSDNQTLA
ncbi:hypothetical protein BU26DRAFT_516387 [Trematosphaeria pertusa]|uniref:Uncharacterized protein n=1 Tax=Trematosphaeria pertusa TaxID=390896 RepID=A0A6A6IMX1_9PLEO|nr:uncharacterized protein BU26DRAFT_516387 [Trematosphaeria pertusa]KAF2251589.1 hypothetical protein BU26DRAFT_516387 [Trematosphaeria pertusa]